MLTAYGAKMCFLPLAAATGAAASEGNTPDGVAESTGTVFGAFAHQLDILFHPHELLDALAGIPFVLASVIVTVGILCVFNGYRWHKWVVAILAFLCGLGLGYRLSQELGKSTIVAAAVGFLFAIIATPLLRITVAVFGGLTGAFIGANTWTALNAAPGANWAGAVIGFIVVAMTSLILFRLVIVLFTSVGGAAMVVLGAITLLMHVPHWEDPVRQSLMANQLVIPLLLLLAAVSGFVIQESRLRAGGLSILSTETGAAGGSSEE